MSGSETGVMTSREPFSVTGLQQKAQLPSQPVIQNMRLTYTADGTAIYKPATTTTSTTSPTYQSAGGGGEGGPVLSPHVSMGGDHQQPMMKRKRGRPRKYGPDGTMALALVSSPQSAGVTQSTTSGGGGGGGFSSPPPAHQPAPAPPSSAVVASAAPASDVGVAAASAPSIAPAASVSPSGVKKARGRPPGSSNKKQQLDALGSAGVGFTPHVITVKAGEDVSSKIMSFSQHGPRAVCILSANGAISNVTLRQQATSGGTVTYEGRFEILALSGSFLPSENGGQRSRTGGLSVCLSGPDGRVLGGSVAGLLTAAAPVQVIVGSFLADGRKESKSANHTEPSSVIPRIPPAGGSTGVSSPPSRGTLSESSGGPGSPLNQSTGACNNSNNPQGMSNMPWK